MPQLGKRPQSALRLNLDPKAHLQSASQQRTLTDDNNNDLTHQPPSLPDNTDSSAGGGEGQSSRKRAKRALLCLQSSFGEQGGISSSSSSRNYSDSSSPGCLSPTDSPQLLEESLRRAAEIQKKQREEEGKIGRFCLLSPLDRSGFSYHALDTRTQKLKTCQVLSQEQYEHLIRVSERLNSQATRNWPYLDAKELIGKILPSSVELIRHSDGKFYLFAEKHNGSLHSFVQTRKKLSEAESRAFFGQIVRLVAFCHSLGIVVRDLKLRKFVFADEKQSILKLGSISDLVVCPNIAEDALSDRHGCPAYVSPEILDLDQKTYSGKAADIWSLGVMLFVMLIGRYPFYAATPAGLFGKIRQGLFVIPPDEKLGQETKVLLRGLLRRQAEERPSALTLLKMPWMERREESLVVESFRARTHSNKGKKLGRFVDNDDQVVPVFVPGPASNLRES